MYSCTLYNAIKIKLMVNEIIIENISELKFSEMNNSLELNKNGEINMNIKQ